MFPSGICISFCLKVLKLFYPIFIILEENWGLCKILVSMDHISGVFCWWDYLDLGNFETLWFCILLGLFFFSYLRFLVLGSHLKNGPSKFVLFFFLAFFFGETFSDSQTMCMCFPSIWECWGLVIYFLLIWILIRVSSSGSPWIFKFWNCLFFCSGIWSCVVKLPGVLCVCCSSKLISLLNLTFLFVSFF